MVGRILGRILGGLIAATLLPLMGRGAHRRRQLLLIALLHVALAVFAWRAGIMPLVALNLALAAMIITRLIRRWRIIHNWKRLAANHGALPL